MVFAQAAARSSSPSCSGPSVASTMKPPEGMGRCDAADLQHGHLLGRTEHGADGTGDLFSVAEDRIVNDERFYGVPPGVPWGCGKLRVESREPRDDYSIRWRETLDRGLG